MIKNSHSPTTIFRIAQVVIIGREDGRTFRHVLQMVQHSEQMQVVAQYQTLSVALQAGLGQSIPADFVIVLQSYSDEFVQEEINDLIGRMMYGRILCCYGPWCTADGRSHDFWPVAFRIPVGSATSAIELELMGFQKSIRPLFPMSASEEVFAHRSQFPDGVEPGMFRTAIVLSDDCVLRETTVRILAALNYISTPLPLTAIAILAHFASDPGSIEVVIVDLDGQAGDVKECLAILQTESRSGIVVGMSVFASSFADTAREDTRQPLEYVEKTEMVLQLQRLLETTF